MNRLVEGRVNKRNNLEVVLQLPPFLFDKFLSKYPNKSFNEIWQILIKDSNLIYIKPEDIGALTDAPILGFKGNIYWFPDYAVINELNQLKETGKVEFQLAYEKNRIDFKEYV